MRNKTLQWQTYDAEKDTVISLLWTDKCCHGPS